MIKEFIYTRKKNINIGGVYMDSFLRIKLANKYNLYHRQRVSFELL